MMRLLEKHCNLNGVGGTDSEVSARLQSVPFPDFVQIESSS